MKKISKHNFRSESTTDMMTAYSILMLVPGRLIFALAFSYVLRSKRGSLLCHIVYSSNFHSLEALEACLEACPEVFYSNFHVLATLDFETCIEACLQLCFILYFFCFAAISTALRPRGLPGGRPFAPAAAKILARQHRHQLLQVQQ